MQLTWRIYYACAQALVGNYNSGQIQSCLAMCALQSSHSRTYSNDLRWRMVHQRSVLGLTYRHLANNLNVDPSTVQRTVQLFEETGTTYSIQGYHHNTTKKLNVDEEVAVIEAVVENPALYLSDLQQYVLHTMGKSISISTKARVLAQKTLSYSTATQGRIEGTICARC